MWTLIAHEIASAKATERALVFEISTARAHVAFLRNAVNRRALQCLRSPLRSDTAAGSCSDREANVTMPDERFRAIRLGGELLKQMQDDPSVPASMRDRAKEIAQDYPSDAALREAIERGPAGVSETWVNAIENAGALFRDLRFSPAGSAETRHQLRYTDTFLSRVQRLIGTCTQPGS